MRREQARVLTFRGVTATYRLPVVARVLGVGPLECHGLEQEVGPVERRAQRPRRRGRRRGTDRSLEDVGHPPAELALIARLNAGAITPDDVGVVVSREDDLGLVDLASAKPRDDAAAG